MNRRYFLAASALPLASLAVNGLSSAVRAEPIPFDRSIVRQIARDLAGKPYKAPENKLPDNLKNLNYAQHRSIRFSTDRALWHGEKLPFEAQFFHRGFRYANRVDMYEVKDGHAAKIAYQRDHFSFDDIQPPGPGVDLDFVTNQTGQRGATVAIDPHLAIARARIEEAENYEEAIGYLSEREKLAVRQTPAILVSLMQLPQAG